MVFLVSSIPQLDNSDNCPCGSQLTYTECCGPYIAGSQLPNTAEALMRSRYSAYTIKQYDYIVTTYSAEKRINLSVQEIAKSDQQTQWLKLVICQSDHDQVEFKAFYQTDGEFYLLHEMSNFVQQNGRWVYHDGEIYPDSGRYSPGRNDPCVCGSNKKFKKCCA